MASILLSAFASSLTLTAAPEYPSLLTDESARTPAEALAPETTRTTRGLPIINDDFEKARTEANKRKLPLFVEVWAPW